MHQNYSSASSGGLGFFYLIFIVLFVVAMWKLFIKAGQPGWKAIIPIYNVYILLKIVGRPGWWIILYFIPLVNIVISLIVALDLAKRFGRSDAFGIILLWLFSVIGFLIIGFGNSIYKKVQPAPVPQQQ